MSGFAASFCGSRVPSLKPLPSIFGPSSIDFERLPIDVSSPIVPLPATMLPHCK
jgi:hypothetical protein